MSVITEEPSIEELAAAAKSSNPGQVQQLARLGLDINMSAQYPMIEDAESAPSTLTPKAASNS